jgi:putative RecB family exonuclease
MFPVPTSLSPSRVESFTSCPLAFRFSSIEKLPERPSIHTTRGSLVHRVLELLFTRPAAERTVATADWALAQAWGEYLAHPDLTGLDLDAAALAQLRADAENLTRRYFQMEDPTQVRDIGLELRLEAQLGPLAVRGIIDRLDLDDDGELVITDYKTGRAPGPRYEQQRLSGVHFYALLCHAVLGRRPKSVRLMYLLSGDVIEAAPTERSVQFIGTRTQAVWRAVEQACTSGDFRPRPGPLCNSCSYQRWCPAFGGDPDRARLEAPAMMAP